MRTPRGKVVAWCSVALGAVVLAVCGFVFRDAMIERWYIHQLRSGDEGKRKAAAEKLGEMGSVRAVPYLLHGSSTWPVRFGKSKLSALIRVGSSLETPLGNSTDAFINGNSVDMLFETLVDTLRRNKDEHVSVLIVSGWDAFFMALIRISNVRGVTTVPHFSRGLKHENKRVMLLSAFHLALLGPQADAAVPALRDAQHDSNEDIATFASWALENVRTGKPVRVKVVSESHWDFIHAKADNP